MKNTLSFVTKRFKGVKRKDYIEIATIIIVMDFILPLIAGVPVASLIPGLIALVIWGTIAYSLWSEYA